MTDKEIDALKKKAQFSVDFSSNNKTQITDSQLRTLNQSIKKQLTKDDYIAVYVYRISA